MIREYVKLIDLSGSPSQIIGNLKNNRRDLVSIPCTYFVNKVFIWNYNYMNTANWITSNIDHFQIENNANVILSVSSMLSS